MSDYSITATTVSSTRDTRSLFPTTYIPSTRTSASTSNEISNSASNEGVTDVITTPYVYRNECTALPSFCRPGMGSTFLCVDELRYKGAWSECQPRVGGVTGLGTSGLASTQKLKVGIQTAYTVAVCPSNWVALDLGLQAKERTSMDGVDRRVWSTVSTAWCCASGDSLGPDVYRLYDAQNPTDQTQFTYYSTICTGTWGLAGLPSTRFVNGGLSSSITTPIPITSGTVMYPAWHIEWVGSDTSFLNPPWPSLTSNMLIPTWSEGMSWESAVWDGKGGLSTTSRAACTGECRWGYVDREDQMLAVQIAVPSVVGFLLVAGGVGVWWWRVRRRREAARERRLMGVARVDVLREERKRRGERWWSWLVGGKRVGKVEEDEVVGAELRDLELPLN